MRRAHDALSAKQLSTDPTTGETHLRHHVTADGYYRGKKVIEPKAKVVDGRLIPAVVAAAPSAASRPAMSRPDPRAAACRIGHDGAGHE